MEDKKPEMPEVEIGDALDAAEVLAENAQCPQESCKYFPNCFRDKHHKFFPAFEYATKLEKRYRNVRDNIVKMCRQSHEYLHIEFGTAPPDKPEREDMLDVVEQEFLDGGMSRKKVQKRMKKYR